MNLFMKPDGSRHFELKSVDQGRIFKSEKQVWECVYTKEQYDVKYFAGQLVACEPRFFSHPQVKMIGYTKVMDEAISEINTDLGLGFSTDVNDYEDLLPEYAGRMCYMSHQENLRRPSQEGKGQNETYLDHIKETRHGSVMEHFVYNFLVWDVSRNMTHELVRHRVGVAYSQLSGRYVDQFSKKYFGNTGHSVGMYIPPLVVKYPELFERWKGHITEGMALYYETYRTLIYKEGLEVKQARGLARNIIGGNAGTMIVFSVNTRALEHIFIMRGALNAEDEIRKMAVGIFREVANHSDKDIPNAFKHWEIRTDEKKGEYLAKIGS